MFYDLVFESFVKNNIIERITFLETKNFTVHYVKYSLK